MAKAPTKTQATKELGAAGSYSANDQLRPDEFIAKLKGIQAIRTYREMRENDPIIGALVLAIEMLVRRAEFTIVAADESDEAAAAKQFLEEVFDDMEHPLDEFFSEVITFLPFGFSLFEIVYKMRGGRKTSDPTRRSKYHDGAMGIRKLSPRAQWTIQRFDVTENGDIEAAIQQTVGYGRGMVTLPMDKCLHFRTSTSNNDPSGRSILRNAYTSYYYVNHIEMIEAIAIEREMNGIPLGRIPSEYLAPDATDKQQEFASKFKKILRDVKFNDQGFVLLPSDLIDNEDGTKTNTPQVSFELLTAKGTRAIPTGDVVKRHQQNIARSVLADFLMLGQSEKGSFAMSKSKTELFLAAAEGFTGAIAAQLNRKLIPDLWEINGFDPETMPYVKFGKLAPVDLQELGAFVRDIAGAGITLFPDVETENTLRNAAGLPEVPDDDEMLGKPDADFTD